MSDITMEKKLQLIQQVRSRYHENQYDLSNRERILYGRTGFSQERRERGELYSDAYEDAYGEPLMPSGAPFSFFRLRFLAALLLLALVILMDKSNISVAGITTEKIFEMISADYEDKITEWVETMSGE